ncbi:diheme cytochrome c-553 [Aestuariibaculum suncheonense]|uniref:Diheme cytochrome c-553 n=1 Tax=Aestuariibaculum suncheonense TaxID=1028745 RepID=A0A8J6QH43_9FLAO|nr:diheme cytochrome c-553 [Aestuariibaculum suncheonense]MBD0836390.1 diheme cytochrome c-553 [Aestuariibaculum suncheonense]
MKTKSFILTTLCSALLLACISKEKKETTEVYEPAVVKEEAVDPVKRGEHLVNAIGCHDCHTPKKFTENGMELDFERLLSGHPADEVLPPYDETTAKSYLLFNMGLTAATGPWGTSFGANLTPDETGIGSWTETQFLTAIKKGLYKGMEGSRPLLPPMPWQSYKNLPDDDLKAIFAYLKTIRPIENLVPSNIPPKMN